MKHLRRAVLAVVALALYAAPVEVEARPVASPVHSLGGLSGSELLGEGWAHLMANPAGAFAGTCYTLGHHGKVVVAEADENLTSSCTVKPGSPLYFFFGTECSDVEEPPFFGADAEAQRACAIAFDEFFVAATITVDDGKAVDMLNSRFEVISPQGTVDLPDDNILGVPAQTATFVAHGWAAVVRGLTPGQHTVTVVVEDVDGFVSTFVGTFNVVPRGHA